MADVGSAHALVHGARACRTDQERREWLEMHLEVLRVGSPELLATVRDAEKARLQFDPLADELGEAHEQSDGKRVAVLLDERRRIVEECQRAALGRVHAELVDDAVRWATTPRGE